MKGRLEHELQHRNDTKRYLTDLPDYVSSFYYVISVSLEESTCRAYIAKIKEFYSYINKDLLTTTSADIGRFFVWLEEKSVKNNNKSMSFAYRKMMWTVLNRFYGYLYNEQKIQSNPMNSIGRPKQNDDISRQYLSLDDMTKILDATRCGAGSDIARARQYEWTERDYLIVLLFMVTGMRCAALSEINIEDIDFENQYLYIIDKRNKKHQYNLTQTVINAINEWLDRRVVLLNGQMCDALFISNERKRMTVLSISRIVQKYADEALGMHITPHKLRAGFVTNVYEATGHDIKATCEAVGHSSVATTSIYIRTQNDSREKAIEYMSKQLT